MKPLKNYLWKSRGCYCNVVDVYTAWERKVQNKYGGEENIDWNKSLNIKIIKKIYPIPNCSEKAVSDCDKIYAASTALNITATGEDMVKCGAIGIPAVVAVHAYVQQGIVDEYNRCLENS